VVIYRKELFGAEGLNQAVGWQEAGRCFWNVCCGEFLRGIMLFYQN